MHDFLLARVYHSSPLKFAASLASKLDHTGLEYCLMSQGHEWMSRMFMEDGYVRATCTQIVHRDGGCDCTLRAGDIHVQELKFYDTDQYALSLEPNAIHLQVIDPVWGGRSPTKVLQTVYGVLCEHGVPTLWR